ncbi:hypothetical protein PoB_007404700 [Plakobranchus ocellatus]|uniref:Uncharacterized protein n=1 Tax=Plakobranchus ocellatus TaxID=259542 RepID=A0AAV4DU43_9GAST|nr:hypothetical protein PoB_007404700 [Plakobranchus ocellatus]
MIEPIKCLLIACRSIPDRVAVAGQKMNDSAPEVDADLTGSSKLVSDRNREVFEIVNYVTISGTIGLFGICSNIINIIIFVNFATATAAAVAAASHDDDDDDDDNDVAAANAATVASLATAVIVVAATIAVTLAPTAAVTPATVAAATVASTAAIVAAATVASTAAIVAAAVCYRCLYQWSRLHTFSVTLHNTTRNVCGPLVTVLALLSVGRLSVAFSSQRPVPGPTRVAGSLRSARRKWKQHTKQHE